MKNKAVANICYTVSTLCIPMALIALAVSSLWAIVSAVIGLASMITASEVDKKDKDETT